MNLKQRALGKKDKKGIREKLVSETKRLMRTDQDKQFVTERIEQ